MTPPRALRAASARRSTSADHCAVSGTFTTFSYSNLTVEIPTVRPDGDVRLSFTVQNTGSRSGMEVAQVYLRDDVSSVVTPVMKLVGFTKVELQAGESRRISMTIPPSELALWNRQMERVVEAGTFSLMVGASAETIMLRGAFDVVGTR